VKIAILCPGYNVVSRGVERTITELINRLGKEYSFDIYSRAKSEQISKNAKIIHVAAVSRDSIYARAYASFGHRLRFYLRTPIDAECLTFSASLLPKIIFNKYDVIFNQAGPFAGKVCRSLRRIYGTPFIHKAAAGYGRLEEIMAHQYPDVFIATSPVGEQWIKEKVPNLNSVVIPNGVDTELFAPETGKAKIDLKPPIILFVGAIVHMKRPELLLEAMENIKNASLLMIGDGILKEEIEKAGLKNLGPKRFKLMPSVPHKDLPKYYNACDVFTLPSDEPFGIAFLEAMACDKPVVARKKPTQEWLIEEAGLTCDCENSVEYAETISKILQNSNGFQPRQRAKKFEWNEVATKYDKIFRSFLN